MRRCTPLIGALADRSIGFQESFALRQQCPVYACSVREQVDGMRGQGGQSSEFQVPGRDRSSRRTSTHCEGCSVRRLVFMSPVFECCRSSVVGNSATQRKPAAICRWRTTAHLLSKYDSLRMTWRKKAPNAGQDLPSHYTSPIVEAMCNTADQLADERTVAKQKFRRQANAVIPACCKTKGIYSQFSQAYSSTSPVSPVPSSQNIVNPPGRWTSGRP